MGALNKFWNEHTALSISVIVSLIMLTVFFIFQYQQVNILKLESRWLITSGVPLLVALFIGGYINSFKGFGVELEASLHKPIVNLELSATEGMAEIEGDEKQSLDYLLDLSSSQKRRISRLSFVTGIENHYQEYAIVNYIHELKWLRFFEIKDSDGRFIALLPTIYFKRGGEVQDERIERFVRSLVDMTILQVYRGRLITDQVSEDTDLIDALKIMRKKRNSPLAVTDEKGEFIGLLTEALIEKRIADNVLAAKESA